MGKTSILIGFFMIIIMSISINVVNSNRLIGDVNAYEVRKELSQESKQINEVVTNMKSDFYRESSYMSNDETFALDNKMMLVDSSIRLIAFNTPSVTDTLFLATDKGSSLTGLLQYSDWVFNPNLVEWDGQLIKSVKTSNQIMVYKFIIDENNDEGLKGIYNLDYYTEIPNSVINYDLQLESRVGILVEIKDNAVVSYSILNSNIEDYSRLTAYNLKAEKVMSINKDVLSKHIPIAGTEVLEEVKGHSIEFNLNGMTWLGGQLVGHKGATIQSGPLLQEIPPNQNDFEVEIGTGVDSVKMEIYASTAYQLQLNYSKLVKE